MITITVYNLLGIVKDKADTNTYIRYYDKLDNKTDVMLACKENIIYNLDRTSIELNDEVEILEEEKKIPEKLKLYTPYPECDDTRFEDVENKINEIIDYLEYLKNKGDE